MRGLTGGRDEWGTRIGRRRWRLWKRNAVTCCSLRRCHGRERASTSRLVAHMQQALGLSVRADDGFHPDLAITPACMLPGTPGESCTISVGPAAACSSSHYHCCYTYTLPELLTVCTAPRRVATKSRLSAAAAAAATAPCCHAPA